MTRKPIEEKTWQEFYDSGLLWWVNRTLHLFGWAICIVTDEVDGAEKIIRAYPARTLYRGFDTDTEDTNFKRLTGYLSKNITVLEEEVNLD